VSSPDDRVRPATLVAALWLTAVVGLVNVVVGGALFALLLGGALPRSPGLAGSTIFAVAATYLLLGVLTVVGSVGLRLHQPGSRALVTVLMLVRIAVASVSFGLFGSWYSAGAAVGIVVAVTVIALLWDSRANAYFHTPH
jgi:hypothetical protein